MMNVQGECDSCSIQLYLKSEIMAVYEFKKTFLDEREAHIRIVTHPGSRIEIMKNA